MLRFGNMPSPNRQYHDRPSVYGIIRAQDRVLLARTNSLLLPGGGIDPGESPIRALHREVYEETGWRISPLRRLGVFVEYIWADDVKHWRRKIAQIYLCRPIRQLGPPLESDHTPEWMQIDQASNALTILGERWFMRQLIG